MKKGQKVMFGFAVLLIAAIFTLTGCGDPAGDPSDGDPDLSGIVLVVPNANVTTGTLLTAHYYGGEETVTYQWKRGDTTVGTNTNTYTPDQAGLYYVTVSAEGYKSKTSTAIEVTAPSDGDEDLSGTVTIFPNANVTTGTMLTAYYYGGEETIATYQWKRGNDTVGTNANTYTPDQAGLYYVTVSVEGYKSKTSTAIEVTASTGDPDLSGDISISPTIDVKVNTLLTAAYSGTETVTWQWKRGNDTVGTNANTYTPDQAGIYTVTVSAAGYKSKTSTAVNVTSAAGNTAPKSLYIIGITDEFMSQNSDAATMLIFPAGTAMDDVKADLMTLHSESGYPEKAIAGVEFPSGPVKVGTTYAVTGDLYASAEDRWTGSGTVDMYVLASDGTKGYLYKLPNLLIQSAVTTVSLFDTELSYLGEIELPHPPSISGTITLTNVPTDDNTRIWINVSGYNEEGDYIWGNHSQGGNGVRSMEDTKLPWRIKISDFEWYNSANDGKTDFFPARLVFRISVHFDSDDNDNDNSRNYSIVVNPIKSNVLDEWFFESEEDAVDIDLGTVDLSKN